MPEILDELDLFADVPIRVEVRIGFKDMTVAEIMGLKPGSLLQLDKPAGEELDFVVGDQRIGSAEAVMVDERLTVRILETERWKISEAGNGREKKEGLP